MRYDKQRARFGPRRFIGPYRKMMRRLMHHVLFDIRHHPDAKRLNRGLRHLMK